MLRDIKMLCAILTQYVNNCYRFPARLFLIGRIEIKSKEGTNQGDPAANLWNRLHTTPLLTIMLETIMEAIMIAFADNITAAGICEM